MIKKSDFQLQNIPFLIVYILYPAINIFCRLTKINLFTNWIDILWGLLLIFSIFSILLRQQFYVNRKMVIFTFFVIIIIYLHIALNIIFNKIEIIPLFMELKPFFYVAFVWAWLKVWGFPIEKRFISWGAWLGLILIIDFFVESSIAHQFVRISGSGEINYDAALLVISSCFFIANKSLIMKRDFWKIGLIFLGLLVSLSRTGLLIEILLLIIFWQSNILIKIIPTTIALVTVIYSFVIRNLSLSLESFDRYWMWKTAFNLFQNHPLQFLLGFGVQPLPVIIPPQLSYLWVELQQTGWNLSGIYAYNFHSFWLRFIISWGFIATLPLVILLGYFLFNRNNSRLLQLLSLVSILEGLTMGVIYLGNVAIPLLIAIQMGMENNKYYPFKTKMKAEN